MQILGLLKKASRISVPECGANGFPMTQMLSTNSQKRDNDANTLREKSNLQVLMKRPQVSYFAPLDMIVRSVAGKRVQIMHNSMTTLTQIWMTLLLSNILPNDHNSDLELPKFQLVYNIMMHISVHVAQLISDAIHQFVGIAPPRHPVDPKSPTEHWDFLH